MKLLFNFLLSFFVVANVWAQLPEDTSESKNFNDAVLLDGSIEVKWQNDSDFPWVIEGEQIKNGNSNIVNSKSRISFSYSSESLTQVSFIVDMNYYNSSYHSAKLYIDGKLNESVTETGTRTIIYRLPAGEHTVSIEDVAGSTNSNYVTYLKNVKVVPVLQVSKEAIDSAVVLPGSLPVEWTDHSKDTHPWTIVDGKLKSGNAGYDNSSSTISFTYTSEYPTKLTFDCSNNNHKFNYSNAGYVYHDRCALYLDGALDLTLSETSTYSRVYYLPAGTHTVTLKDSISNNSNCYDNYYYSGLASRHYTILDNVMVTQILPFSKEAADSAVMLPGSLPVEWTNSESHPWGILEGKLRSGNAGYDNSSSAISFTYTCEYPTELSFVCFNNSVSYSNCYHNKNQLFIDGKLDLTISTSGTYSRLYTLPAGTHTVMLKDSIDDWQSTEDNQYDSRLTTLFTTLDNIKVAPILPLNQEAIDSVAVLPGSLPVEWSVNSSEPHPWKIVDGKLKSGNAGYDNSTSTISFTYTSEYPTNLTFDCYNNSASVLNNGEYCYHDKNQLFIDGKLDMTLPSSGEYPCSYRLPAGTHTIMLKDCIDDWSYTADGKYDNRLERLYTTLDNVMVTPLLPSSKEAIDSAVVLPGSLPVEWTDHCKSSGHPWTIVNGKLESGNVGYDNSSSAISFTYTSEYPTELTFDCYNSSAEYYYSDKRTYCSHKQNQLYIDGKLDLTLSSNGTWSRHYRLPAGTHTVMLKDSIQNWSYTEDYHYDSRLAGLFTILDNVMVTPILPQSKEAIDSAVVLPGSLPVEWTDHSTKSHPWKIVDGKLRSGNAGYDNSSSAISFTYTSEYPTELKFTCANNDDYNANYYHTRSQLFIDGKLDLTLNYASSWARHYRLPPGTHTVMLKDSIRNHSDLNDTYYYSNLEVLYTTLDNVMVTPVLPTSEEAIDSAVVLPGSLPVEWTDHSTKSHPWKIVDGKLRSGNAGYDNSSSAISFTYTSEYPTELKFTCANNDHYNDGYYHDRSQLFIDGKLDLTLSSTSSWSRHYRLPPGTHTVMLKDSIPNYSDFNDTYYYSNLEVLYTTLDNVMVAPILPQSKEAIDSAVVLPGSLPVEWTDHSTKSHPWKIVDGKLRSGNAGYDNSSSTISFTYTSEFPTELTFDCANNQYRYGSSSYCYHDESQLFIDGELDLTLSSTSSWSRVYYLPSGTHTVMLKDSIDNWSSNSDTYYNSNIATLYTTLDNVKVVQMPDIHSTVLAENSLPMTFDHSSGYVWKTENGYAQSTNANVSGSESYFYSTITIDKPSLLSFEWLVGKDYSSHYTQFIINDVVFASNSTNTSWTYQSVVLPAGTYTVKWRDYNGSSNSSYYSRVRNISLTQDWVEVNTVAGMLGIEVLYKVDRLKDVKLLKVKGTMNSDDWENIKLMENLQGIDLSEVNISSIGSEAFKSNPYLSYVVLPKELKTISSSAFNGIKLYSMNIPASVTTIGSNAFNGQGMHHLHFEENSKLSSIAYRAFYDCYRLKEIIIPDAVSSIGEQAFATCDDLQRIHFPDSLATIPVKACYNNSKLQYVHLPKNLKTIGANSFYYNSKLTDIVLPENLTEVGKGAFRYCSISNVNFPGTLQIVGDSAFYNCDISDIRFSDGLKSIGAYAFAGCYARKLTLPETLNSIGISAFYNCNLDSVSLPLRMATLGAYAFESNDSLVYVSLPSMSSFGAVFKACPKIKTVVCPVATPPTISSDPFASCNKAEATLIVPAFAIAPYKLDQYWYDFGKIIAGGDVDYWRIQSDLRLLNNRRMDGKPDIDLYYGGALTVGGDAPMSVGRLNIYESESKPSRLVNESPDLVVDEINVMYSVTANKWHYITPMVDVDLKDIGLSSTTNFVFRCYDGATRAEIGAGSSWKNVSDMMLKAGTGYIFQCNKDGVLSLPVKTEQHSQLLMKNAVTLPLVAHPSDNSANKGWNYLGNPYPCYYDIYYMDFTAPITVWTGSTYKAYSITDDDFVLSPMQGFFVQKPDAIDRIVLQPNGCQVESSSKRGASMAPSKTRRATERNIFNIEVSVDTLVDMTRVVVNENAGLEYEMECDAAKFMSTEEYMPQVFTVDGDGNFLAINERPLGNCIVPLGLYIPDRQKRYTLSASKAGKDLFLLDNASGMIVANLAEEAYEIHAEAEGYMLDRYALQFDAGNFTRINEVADAVSVTGDANGILVSGCNNARIAVYTVDGKPVESVDGVSGEFRANVQHGVYVVDVDGTKFKVVVR